MDPAHDPGAGVSLRSTVPSGVDAAADLPKSCLLATTALVTTSTNATTAFCPIKDPDDSRSISFRVSLFLARPPLVSYAAVWCTDVGFTDDSFTAEPFIHSTHGGLILLSMSILPKRSMFPEFYIYQPGAPSLELVPQFMDGRFVWEPCADRLLSHGGGGGGGYSVAVLTTKWERRFDLCIFCSKMGTWTIKKPLFLLEDGDTDFMPDEVIAVGGGVLAFVDWLTSQC